MKYVDLNATIGGVDGVIDPTRYLDHIPSFAADLPGGARAFATDPHHYDFHSRRCVKDLALEGVELGDVSVLGETAIELRFRHNCWKQEEDLTLRYVGVRSLTLDGPQTTSPPYLLGPVVLD